MAVAAFSTVVEWYDFALYLFMTTVLSRVFFGSGAGSVLTALEPPRTAGGRSRYPILIFS